MATERYVLLGLASVRSAWFREVSRWSNSATLPIEFVKAMSLAEVQARLGSGRAFSALLVDDAIPGFDRDVIDLAREAGCAVVVVDGGRGGAHRWSELGASATLPAEIDPAALLQILSQVARPVSHTEASSTIDHAPAEPLGYRAGLVAVTGPGGTGASTVAIGLAQGLARDPRGTSMVCLADLALDGELAMLHGSPDVVPGLLELVDAFRLGAPTSDEVRSLTWSVEVRGYQLLLGLRRHRDWTSLRPRALGAALDGLRRSFRLVVADVDADLEGERATGSMDVEERNVLARTAIAQADLVVIVGTPGMKGLHSLLRVTRDVLDHGVPGDRVVPVLNRSAKSPRARAELTRAFGQLLDASAGAVDVPSPLHLAERRHLDLALRDGSRLPDPWLAPLSRAVMSLLEDGATTRGEPEGGAVVEPVPIAPGSLGSWTEQAELDGDGAR